MLGWLKINDFNVPLSVRQFAEMLGTNTFIFLDKMVGARCWQVVVVREEKIGEMIFGAIKNFCFKLLLVGH